MKNIVKISFAMLIVFTFTTCKKEIGFTHVEGTAQDFYSKQALANTTVKLFGPEGEDNGFITSVKTDANGHFEFNKFRALKSGSYYVNIGENGYDTYNKDGSANIEKGEKNVLKPTLVKKVNVKFVVENIHFQNDSDKFCAHADYSADIVDNGQIIPESCFYGNYYRESNFEVTANVIVKYFYSVTRNSNLINYKLDITYRNDTIVLLKY